MDYKTLKDLRYYYLPFAHKKNTKVTVITYMRCAIYSRVSTTNGQTAENQINVLKEIAKLEGYELVREFTDEVLFGFFRWFEKSIY